MALYIIIYVYVKLPFLFFKDFLLIYDNYGHI